LSTTIVCWLGNQRKPGFIVGHLIAKTTKVNFTFCPNIK